MEKDESIFKESRVERKYIIAHRCGGIRRIPENIIEINHISFCGVFACSFIVLHV